MNHWHSKHVPKYTSDFSCVCPCKHKCSAIFYSDNSLPTSNLCFSNFYNEFAFCEWRVVIRNGENFLPIYKKDSMSNPIREWMTVPLLISILISMETDGQRQWIFLEFLHSSMLEKSQWKSFQYLECIFLQSLDGNAAINSQWETKNR